MGSIRLLFVLAWCSIFWNDLNAQYTAVSDIPVRIEGQELFFPLTGGTEAPQFAHFYLNQDDIPDLLVFDRVGSRIIPFLAIEEETGIDYAYAPQYNDLFPEMYQLMEIKDLNCDGLEDVVTTRRIGVSAAEVTLVAHLQLNQGGFGPGIDFFLEGGASDTLLRTHAFDRPALEDIDGDGLIDLLYIPIGGTKIQYYRNVSELEEDNCSSMQFALADDCWGLANYTLTADFELQSCEPGFTGEGVGCAGSVMLARDYDLDGDKDLFFSGLYDYEVLRLTNGGDTDSSDLISQDIFWLNTGQPLLVFPSPFFLDLYNDGEQDLLVAGNSIGGFGNNPDSDLLYRFTATEEGDWAYQEKRFFIEDMLDFGFRSSPAVWDVNLDGLPDLLLAFNQSHPVFGYSSQIAYFENTGTITEASFELVDMDFAGLSAYNYKAIHPSFGDLNGDEKPEMVIGTENGRMEVFTNVQEGTDLYTPLTTTPLSSFILNGLAKPQLIDLNRDNLLDIVVGTRNGTLSYLENTGSPTLPQFELVTDTLAEIIPEDFFQESTVSIQPLGDENFELFYGRRDGTIDYYTGNLGEGFTLEQTKMDNIDVGERLALCLADLNQDGRSELIAGNMRGGLEIFSAPPLVSQTEQALTSSLASVFPNPFDDYIRIEALSEGQISLSLFDVLGRQVFHKKADQEYLDTRSIKPGIYYYVLHRQGQKMQEGSLVKY